MCFRNTYEDSVNLRQFLGSHDDIFKECAKLYKQDKKTGLAKLYDYCIEYNIITTMMTRKYVMDELTKDDTKMTINELSILLKNRNFGTINSWFYETGTTLEDPEQVEAFNQIIDHAKGYGLITEVIEWTTKFYVAGNSFETSVMMALEEWDL